jgi:hypothetical protein
LFFFLFFFVFGFFGTREPKLTALKRKEREIV